MPQVAYKIGEENYSPEELVRLGADNPDLYYQLFFPKTVRHSSAPFHLELDAALENPNARFVHARMFRGSAKTTRLRMYTGRRIAYGLSHTILYVGASEGHAARSIKWLRRQIEVNKVFSGVFGLTPGAKWQETELEIRSKITGETCWVLGAGITGNVRGINFDDYRPDLIILDDVLTDENTATKEQRDKVNDLILGALVESLAPETDDPNAKIAFAQTPFNLEDASFLVEKSDRWKVLTIPCWTDETMDSPTEQQNSRWEERIPSTTLRAAKRDAARLNKLSTWIRENEVRIVSSETRAFKSEWLQVIDIMPEYTQNILAIDPVPPPSDREVAKGLVGKDYEVLGIIGRQNENYFLKEYVQNRGHQPSWTIAEFFRLAQKYRILKVVISAIAYEKTLKWILDQEMKRKQLYFWIDLDADKRPKYQKITSTINGLAANGRLYCRPEHTDFIMQFTDYPAVDHDDILDMTATGLSRFINPVLEVGFDNYRAAAGQKLKIPRPRGCP